MIPKLAPRCAAIWWRCMNATRPANHYWNRCCILRAFTPCRATASPTGCCAEGGAALRMYLQSRISEVFAVDINPAARIGRGICIDHGTGVVVGETAVIEDGVSLLQGVSLGGTGKETGDRHPKIRKGVLIGAGASVLGNIEIGECARIGAGSVVLANVPAHCTAAGVPAKIVGCAGSDAPARDMQQQFDCGEDNGPLREI